MRIVFIETNRLTNEIIRAVAGAAPNCVGYPDGVPESWRDVAPVKQVPGNAGKHFTDETEGGAGGGARDGAQITLKQFNEMKAALQPRPDSPLWAIDGVGLVREDDMGAMKLIRRGGAVGGIATVYEEDLDPAALLGPVVEPVDWPDERGDDEC